MKKIHLPRTLHLTSPLMHGPDVSAAQGALRTNVFKQDFMHDSAIDGQWGTDSCSAAARAHYWIGDETSQRVMGQRLADYLTGTARLPADNARRRAHRLELAKQAAASKTVGQKMIDEMRTHIGVKESPSGTNVVMFNEWYYNVSHAQALRMWTPDSPGPPWCAVCVTYCGVKVGAMAFVKGERYAYVPYIYNDAKAGKYGLSITHTPVVGDLVIYDWPGESPGVADHVGLFESWRVKGKTIVAVEGNTGYGNNSNGGEVMRRGLGSDYRTTAEIKAFVHVSR